MTGASLSSFSALDLSLTESSCRSFSRLENSCSKRAVAALAGVESLRILSKLTKPIFRSCCACAESGTSKDSSKASPSLVVFLVTDFNSISAMLNKYVNKPGPKRVKSSIYARRTSIMPLEHQNPVPNWNWNRCVRSNDCGFIGYPNDILSGPTGEIQLKPKPVL